MSKKIYSYDVCGRIKKLDSVGNGENRYFQMSVIPLGCNRSITFFVSPKYKNGKENPVYKEVCKLADNDKVTCRFSSLNSSLFLLDCWKVVE